MATNNQQPEHENAKSRRQERREHDKEQYRNEGNEMRQGGPDPNLQHHDRTRPGDGGFTPDSESETGSTDGIATTITGDGGNNGGRYRNLDEVTPTDSDQGGTKGAGQSREPHLRTPSAQTSHTSKGPRGDHGRGGSQGSKSGNQE